MLVRALLHTVPEHVLRLLELVVGRPVVVVAVTMGFLWFLRSCLLYSSTFVEPLVLQVTQGLLGFVEDY